jgi:hypothetical protein
MKVKTLLEKSLANIEQDRDAARELLEDVSEYIGNNPERFAQVGLTAAKYLETLQRSNEQIVKVASMIMKKVSSEEMEELTREDTVGFYEDFEKEESREDDGGE